MTGNNPTTGINGQIGIDATGAIADLTALASEFAKIGRKLGEALGDGLTAGFDPTGLTAAVDHGLQGAGAHATQLGQQIGQDLANGIQSANPLGGIGGGGGGGGAGPAATAAGVAIGTAIGNAASKALEKGLEAASAGVANVLDRDASSDKLAGQLALSPEEAARLGKLAGTIYANNFGDDFGQVNDTLRAAMSEGILTPGSSDAEIGRVTEQMLGIAKTFDQESTDISRAVGQMLRTGLADNASEAMDILTRGMQTGANKADDIFDTFNEYSTYFRDLGLDGSQAMGLISQAMKGGARDSDIAADAFKEFSLRAKTDESADFFKQLGLNGKEMVGVFARGGPEAAAGLGTVLDGIRKIEDPVKRNTVAVGLFGSQAEDLAGAFASFDTGTAVSGLGEVTGAVDKMNETVGDNASAKIETFKRGVESAFIDTLGGDVIPMVEGFSKTLGLGADDLGLLMKVLVPLAGVLVAVKVGMLAASAAQTLWSAVTTVAAGVAKAYAAAQWLMNTALLANPLTWIVIAIIALVAVLILAWKKSDTFKEIVTGAFDAVAKAVQSLGAWFGKVFTWIGTALTKAWTAVTGWVSRTVAAIGSLASRAAAGFTAFITGVARFVTGAIAKGVRLLVWWATLPARIALKLAGLAADLVTAGSDAVGGFIQGIKDKAGDLLGIVKSALVDPVKDAITGAFQIHSPSRWFAAMAGHMMAGWGGGLIDHGRTAVGAAVRVADSVKTAMMLPPPTVAGVTAAGAASFGDGGTNAGLIGGGNRTVAMQGPVNIYTGTPGEFIDEMSEHDRFAALGPGRG